MATHTLLIRKSMRSGTKGNVTSTLAAWNIALIDFPFKVGGKTKELYSNSWLDEHGDDVYIPDELPIESYELTAKFAYKGGLGTAYSSITGFRQFLTGEDTHGADLEIYDARTGIGRQHCYLVDFPEENFFQSNIDEGLEFDVVFKVTDPITAVTLSL